MSKFQKKIYRYSNCFKEKVVQEVSSGSSISEVCRRYGIKGGYSSELVETIWQERIVKYSNTSKNAQ